MSSSTGKAASEESMTNNKNNRGSSFADDEATSAPVPAASLLMQQHQTLFGSFLVPTHPSSLPFDERRVQQVTGIPLFAASSLMQPAEHNKYVQVPVRQFALNQDATRGAVSQQPELNFTVSPNVSMGGYTANPLSAFVPYAEHVVPNSRANFARGRMPRLSPESSSPGKKVVEQADENKSSQQKGTSPRSPIINRLYDPSFADKGEPVDPHLRMLRLNPNFCAQKNRK